jgi:hypothetical protein
VKLLEGALARAKLARQNLPTFGQGKVLAQITEILTGPSVELPAIPVPFEQRTLDSEAEIIPTITMTELKKQAVAAFDAAKRSIQMLKESWALLDEIAREIDDDRHRLEKQASLFGRDAVPAIPALVAKIRAFEHVRKTDPYFFTLATEDRLWPRAEVKASVEMFLSPELGRARGAVKGLEKEREAIADKIRSAPAQIEHLMRRREKALSLYQESQTELKSTEGLRVPPSLKELTAQLKDLEAVLTAGDWTKAAIGIETWLNTHEVVQDATEQAVTANRARLARLKELRSRWMTARQRREECEKSQPIADKALDRFGERAEQLLTLEPDLEQAEQMIYSYETRLGELLNRLRK